jgi:hypothetical protein
MNKGYYVSYGYMGWTGKKYILFSTETDYREFILDEIKEGRL